MNPATARHEAGRRMAIRGALVALFGLLLSGPVSIALLAMVRKSVGWNGADDFAKYFWPMQVAPFYFGFVLVVGYLMLFAGLYDYATDDEKPRARVAVMLATAYGALITLNYVCQTTFIPALATHYRPAYEGLVDAFSITNPRSLAWAIEMWGYALLGGATWFVAGLFRDGRQQRLLASLLVLNGFASIVAAMAAAADMSWIVESVGFFGYVAWNVLMAAIFVLVVMVLTPRRASV